MLEEVRLGFFYRFFKKGYRADFFGLIQRKGDDGFGDGSFKPTGEGTEKGAFIEPHLLVCQNPENGCGAHDIEAFGPMATVVP